MILKWEKLDNSRIFGDLMTELNDCPDFMGDFSKESYPDDTTLYSILKLWDTFEDQIHYLYKNLSQKRNTLARIFLFKDC